MWTKAIANLSDQLTSNGGFFELERYSLNFPQGATNQDLNLEIQSAPVAKLSGFIESIGSTLTVIAKDLFGNPVTGFFEPFTLSIDFSSFDLTNYDPESLSIYSSEDGTNWVKEETTIDEKTASAQINHLSHFALMAERIDTAAPTTIAILSGDEGQPGWYRTNVQLTLDAQDNEGGLGVDYTLYKVNDEDWQEYNVPAPFTEEGQYNIEFYSVDEDENIEEVKSIQFNIDKTLPETILDANPKLIWSQNGRLIDVEVIGDSSDTNLHSTSLIIDDEYNVFDSIMSVNPTFTQIIPLEGNREGSDLDGRMYIIKLEAEDLAGNSNMKQIRIIVPHDQGKNL